MADDKIDFGNAAAVKATDSDTEREKVRTKLQNIKVGKNNTKNSNVDGLNQAATPNNDLEPGTKATTESDES